MHLKCPVLGYSPRPRPIRFISHKKPRPPAAAHIAQSHAHRKNSIYFSFFRTTSRCARIPATFDKINERAPNMSAGQNRRQNIENMKNKNKSSTVLRVASNNFIKLAIIISFAIHWSARHYIALCRILICFCDCSSLQRERDAAIDCSQCRNRKMEKKNKIENANVAGHIRVKSSPLHIILNHILHYCRLDIIMYIIINM